MGGLRIGGNHKRHAGVAIRQFPDRPLQCGQFAIDQWFVIDVILPLGIDNHINLFDGSLGFKSEAAVKQIDVVINAQGQYYVNDKPLINSKLATLQRAIRELSDGDTSMPFVITADAQTAHEYVVRAMDVAGRLGFSKLSITTQQAGAEQ